MPLVETARQTYTSIDDLCCYASAVIIAESRWPVVILALTMSACSLSSNVTIQPLNLTPKDVKRHPNAVVAFEHGDYPAVLSRSEVIEALSDDPIELAALGRAELFGMRLADAERHLVKALEFERNRERRSRILWDLSQVAIARADIGTALERAKGASDGGLEIRRWFFRLHEQLIDAPPHRLSGSARKSEIDLQSDKPALPRILVTIEGRPARGIIDTGSALTIISSDMADGLAIQRLHDTKAIVRGLLSEPIDVEFGLLRSLKIGSIEIADVPVAIMSTRKLEFAIGKGKQFQIDLLLGTGLLKNFIMTLDYKRERVAFDWIGDTGHQPQSDQNMFLIENRPFVMSSINGKAWYPMMLDTGSEVTFLNLTKIEVRDLRSIFPRVHAANLQGLGGAIKTGVRVDDVAVGAAGWAGVFDNLPLYRDDRTDTLGILGQNFLENFVVTIDFQRMRFDIRR